MARVTDTGNPIFDFRAGFRRTAAAAQRWLWRLGLIVIGLSLVAAIAGQVATLTRATAWYGVLAGAGLAGAGIAWGYYWRWRVREDFKRAYGAGIKK